MTAFRLTAATEVGYTRDHNEDDFIVNPDLTKDEWLIPESSESPVVLGEYGCVFAVADGMGGANAGEVASAIAVSEVKTAFSEANLGSIVWDEHKVESFMLNLIKAADKSIKTQARKDSDAEGMGTTIVLVWVLGCRAYLAWCGDSRAYIFNSTNGLNRFSKDHSYVQELVDKGVIDDAMAFNHPDSNVITRCLGDFPKAADPEFKSYYLQNGDFILLCSDGLCGYCMDDEIGSIMHQTSDDIYNCNKRLIDAALNAGGYDNITTVLFQLVPLEQSNHSDSVTVDYDDGQLELDTLKFASKGKKSRLIKFTLIVCTCLLLAWFLTFAIFH